MNETEGLLQAEKEARSEAEEELIICRKEVRELTFRMDEYKEELK